MTRSTTLDNTSFRQRPGSWALIRNARTLRLGPYAITAVCSIGPRSSNFTRHSRLTPTRQQVQLTIVVPYGEPYEYAGPDLVAAWFQRNIRIYRNIIALIDSPNERILAIYGSGHLGWLQQSVANDGTARLRNLADLTTKQR